MIGIGNKAERSPQGILDAEEKKYKNGNKRVLRNPKYIVSRPYNLCILAVTETLKDAIKLKEEIDKKEKDYCDSHHIPPMQMTILDAFGNVIIAGGYVKQ